MAPGLPALWKAARKLNAVGRGARATPPLLFFTDPVRTPDPVAAAAALPPGAGVVYRAFGAADAEVLGAALALTCRRLRLTLFVGADPRLAARLRAPGLHLPERLTHRAGDLRRWRRRFIVTAAAHDIPAVLRARGAGAQAIIISPVFASASASAGRPLGPRRLAGLARLAGVPVIALGGVNSETARRLALAGVGGVAAVEAVGVSSAAKATEVPQNLNVVSRRTRGAGI